VKITVEADIEEGLPSEVMLAFFRVVQESVHNSVRHGGATEVNVRFYRDGEETLLEVTDDGTGFDPPEDFEELRVRGHRGLANMSERMSLIGGRLEVSRLPGGGTLVRCSWSFTSASA
jgi:signal transduction histidine kinase